MMSDLNSIAQHLAQRGKGILAADESTGTIKKRFDTIKLESTESSRRDYREILFTAPNLKDYVCGVILFEETLGQNAADGTPLSEILHNQGILPGIKVDKGLIPLVNSKDEKITQGLDGLPERFEKYYKQGARFAKWRAVYDVDAKRPSMIAIHSAAENLARYAAITQNAGMVPIVEPEVLINGSHDLARCEEVTERVLRAVFRALAIHKVTLEHIVLKPSMVISGDNCPNQASAEEVAEATVRVLKRCVPSAVPTINFLSGGQTPVQATEHLNLMNKQQLPWNLSFSYGRALQEPCLKAWAGNAANTKEAQEILTERCRLNALAAKGEYQGEETTV